MLAKLLGLLATAKGATATVVIVTVAAGGTVVATNPDLQRTVQQTIALSSPKAGECPKTDDSGQPEVVSLRNDIDAQVRDVYQADQKALEKLRTSQVESSKKQVLEDLVKDSDTKLHARYQKALDDVAALTLGREGHAAPTPTPATNVAPASASPATKSMDESCASTEAKVKVGTDALPKLSATFTSARTDMDDIVKKATTAASALTTAGATPTHGRPESATPSPRP